MRGDFKAAIRYFKTLVTNDISYYVFSDQWKAVSFDFIHHEGIRADAFEENIRQDMREIVFFGLAIMFYDFYRHCIQLEAGYGKPNYPNEHGGFESVKTGLTLRGAPQRPLPDRFFHCLQHQISPKGSRFVRQMPRTHGQEISGLIRRMKMMIRKKMW
jgi:hypothetical protein